MKPASTDEPQPEQGICQDMYRPRQLTINNLPDEVLLEIFDAFRQGVDPYDQKWKKEHLWFTLAHVCGKWRDVMFASTARLELGITVGPKKPGHIKTILSGTLPIFLDYRLTDEYVFNEGEHEELEGSALWRLRAVLRNHPDRVREIEFEGEWTDFFKFYKLTSCVFPMLESLYLGFFWPHGFIPTTFLKGPDLSELPHLRRLTVNCYTFSSIFDFLSTATSVTHLTLVIDTPWGRTPETSLFACLQAMPCLLSLNVTIYNHWNWSPQSVFEHTSVLEDDVIMLCPPKEALIFPKLEYIHFFGSPKMKKAFINWCRAPTFKGSKSNHAPPSHRRRVRLPYIEDLIDTKIVDDMIIPKY